MSIWLIICAIILDLLIGDPVYCLHPVRLIGKLALTLERAARTIIKAPKTAGLLTALLTISIPSLAVLIIVNSLLKLSYSLGFLSAIFFVYSTIACKDMIKHSKTIHTYLHDNNLLLARAATSSIVGRDTKHLTEKEVIRATVESIAENSVDGVLAPLFYVFIGNLIWGIEGAAVLAILYRSINTLDSSFGYKNERYLDFGRASAKIDDLFNLIPARLSLVFIGLGAFISNLSWLKALKTGIRDHRNHASPNSGFSEAAFAGALGLKFGGETYYQGEKTIRPGLGDHLKEFTLGDIPRACTLLFNTTISATLCYSLIIFVCK